MLPACFEDLEAWSRLELDPEEVLVLVSEPCDHFAILRISLWPEEEVTEVDYEEKGEATQNDVHVRVASHYQDVVDQLNHKDDEGLQPADKECEDWSFKLPRVVQGVLHVLEALRELCLHIDVEDESAAEPSDHDGSADWLHVEVEQLVDEDDGREELQAYQEYNGSEQRLLLVLSQRSSLWRLNELSLAPALFAPPCSCRPSRSLGCP